MSADADEINASLLILVPRGRITLVAIHPSGRPIVCRTFAMPVAAREAASWAAATNGQGSNVYWQVNDSSRINARVTASEIEAGRYVWADIDPKVAVIGSYSAAREDLMNRVLPTLAAVASVVVDSGNGLQALFRLDSPIDLQDAETRENYLRVNRAIGEKYEGPGTHNADRILRLPGTLNYPSVAKLRKGYPSAPSLSRIIFSADRTFSREQLEQWVDHAAAQPSSTRDAAAAIATRAHPPQPETPRAVAVLRAQLSHISADCSYEIYCRVVWAIMSTEWRCAHDLALEWSRTAPARFEQRTFDTLVRTHNPSRADAPTLGSIHHLARAGGWHG